MEPVQLMQFDLGLFGGEAHGSSVLSTLLSSHKSMETEDIFPEPHFKASIFSTSSVSYA